MAKKRSHRRNRGRVKQPSYMTTRMFQIHCHAQGLETDEQIGAFFKVHPRTAARWRSGACPIDASTAMLLWVMDSNAITPTEARNYLDD